MTHDTTSRYRPIIDNGDGTATVPLANGQTAIIDSDDADTVRNYHWTVAGRGYVVSSTGVKMHRLIMQAPDGVEVDHEDLDRLNNRRGNLRYCTSAQNKWNLPIARNNTSGYKGVSYRRDRNKFRAYINLNNRQIALGNYTHAEEAARAYDAKARELFGEFARLNFPEDE